MGEGLCLFSVSSTLLVKDKPLRGAYASLTSVDDTLHLKQAVSPPCASRMAQIKTALEWPHFTVQVVPAKRNMHNPR